MVDLERRKEYVISQLGDDYLDAGQYHLRYQCPECKELGKTYSDYKLYVNYGPKYQRGKVRGGWCFCQRCNFKVKLPLDTLFESNSEAIDILMKYGFADDCSDEEEEEESWFMIPSTKPVPGTTAWDYIVSRGITPGDIDFYDIRVPELKDNKLFFGRFIVPNQVKGKIFTDMYVARTYVNDPRRYKNPASSERNHIVFNLHRIPENCDRVIINEGCINSIVAGRDSVATFGKYVSDEQLDMILAKHPKKVYVSLDLDAHDKAVDLCRRIRNKTDKVEVYLMEFDDDRDASDLGRYEYMKVLERARLYTDDTTYVIENFLLGGDWQ